MNVLATEVTLFGLTGLSAIKFLTTSEWQPSLLWWMATMICLINFWFLGVPRLVRYAIMIFSGLAVANQFSNNLTLTHIVFGLIVLLVTLLLCHSQYAADVVWSVKTIVIDWLICTTLVIVSAVLDAVYDKKILVLVMSYFCSSNIFGVVIMKASEYLVKWRSDINAPCARYIHNLSLPIPSLPSLHMKELLAVAWMLVFILWNKAEVVMNETGVAKVPSWQLIAASGLWGSLFCYMCPIIACRNPVPEVIPAPLNPTLRQRREN